MYYDLHKIPRNKSLHIPNTISLRSISILIHNGFHSRGVKQPEHKPAHSSAPRAEVKNTWHYTSTPPYTFMKRTRTMLPFTRYKHNMLFCEVGSITFMCSLWMYFWCRMFLWQMVTDLFFLAGTNSAVKLHTKRGATIYYYYFDYRGSTSFSNLATNSTADYGEWVQFVGQVNICNDL